MGLGQEFQDAAESYTLEVDDIFGELYAATVVFVLARAGKVPWRDEALRIDLAMAELPLVPVKALQALLKELQDLPSALASAQLSRNRDGLGGVSQRLEEVVEAMDLGLRALHLGPVVLKLSLQLVLYLELVAHGVLLFALEFRSPLRDILMAGSLDLRRHRIQLVLRDVAHDR